MGNTGTNKPYTGRHRASGSTGHASTKREGGTNAGSSGGKAILSDRSGSFGVGPETAPDNYERG